MFSGFSWHHEFHSTNPKKEKAADCIYLTKDRKCTCKKSPQYLEKCFRASYCPCRVKSDGTIPHATSHVVEKEKSEYTLNCTLPIDTIVHSKAYGSGRVAGCEKEERRIIIDFVSGETHKFKYPDIFLSKHLLISEEMFDIVLKDIEKAEKEIKC